MSRSSRAKRKRGTQTALRSTEPSAPAAQEVFTALELDFFRRGDELAAAPDHQDDASFEVVEPARPAPRFAQ